MIGLALQVQFVHLPLVEALEELDRLQLLLSAQLPHQPLVPPP